MVDAGVIDVKGQQAEQHKKRPEQQKKPEQFTGELATVRKPILPAPYSAS